LQRQFALPPSRHPQRAGCFWLRPGCDPEKPVRWATRLLLTLIIAEEEDIGFAVMRDPFIVCTANTFALLGLRSVYFIGADAVERFKNIKYGLALVLTAINIFWNFLLHKQFKLLPFFDPPWALLITVTRLGGAIIYSRYRAQGQTPQPAA
jgi:tellurite resistance protein TerC